jgi:regulator of nucleoside diphosphate kinase
MTRTYLTLSERDRILLLDAIESARSSWRTCAPYLHVLRERVLTARTVPTSELPADCVMIGDRVRLLHVRPALRETVRLILPSGHGPYEDTLSVISPLGVELIGARTGAMVRWFSDDRPRQTVVEEVMRWNSPQKTSMHTKADVTPDSAPAERQYCEASNLVSTCPK